MAGKTGVKHVSEEQKVAMVKDYLGGATARDEAGNRYGRLLVLKRAGSTKNREAQWLCRCDCGNERVVRGSSLRREHSKSCGCLRKGKRREGTNEVGNKYGRWIVLQRAERKGKWNGARWLCRCSCGTEREVDQAHLRDSSSKSCGCLKNELTKSRNRRIALPAGQAAINNKFSSWKLNAKRRGYKWELTKEQAFSLSQQNCHYCSASPANCTKSPRNNGTFIYNGLDRIDNSLGYVSGNVVPCCWKCNRAKGTMTVEEFSAWLCRAYEHWGKKEKGAP